MMLVRHSLLGSLVVIAALVAAGTASAEIVVFTSGRTTTVKAHRDKGDQVVLVLAGGGEVVCARSLVDRILPDELPAFADDSKEAIEGPPLPAAYQEIIEQAALRHGVNARLVRALIQVESAYQAQARSRKGAMGLMQLMPETARRFSVTNPYDPRSNIEAGTKYLKALLDRFDMPALALAAYNAGENAVERFGGIPPYAETRSYVRAVLKLAGLTSAR
ncbi:MAG: lytic transglycosylase domain-containing protein [Bacteroidales bacterium]